MMSTLEHNGKKTHIVNRYSSCCSSVFLFSRFIRIRFYLLGTHFIAFAFMAYDFNIYVQIAWIEGNLHRPVQILYKNNVINS